MMRKGILRLLLAAAWIACSSTVLAQDNAAAAALFEKGLEEMEAGRYSTGCPLLAESFRLDPLPGALFTLAECEAKAGKVASAVAHYDDYLQVYARMTGPQQTKQHGRDKTARDQIEKLKPHVPTLTLVLPADAATNVIIKRNGVAMGLATLRIPLPVDPGKHVITTQFPGGPVHEQQVSIAADEKKTVVLELPPAVAPPATAPAATAAPTSTAPGVAATSSANNGADAGLGKSRKTWAYIAGGTGAVGIVVGTIAGVAAMNKKSVVSDNCEGTICTHEGKVAADAGRDLALLSTIGFGVGIAGLATGAVLLLTGKPEPAAQSATPARTWSPIVTGRSNGGLVGLQGTW